MRKVPAIFMTLQICPSRPSPSLCFSSAAPIRVCSFLGRWIYEFTTAFIRGSKVQIMSSFFMSSLVCNFQDVSQRVAGELLEKIIQAVL